MEPTRDAEKLLRRCQQGDEQALIELVRQYQDRLFRLAFRVVDDEALAEEAAVDAFQRIWSKSTQWRGESGAEAWMYRITVRCVLDLRKSRRRWWSRQARFSTLTINDATPSTVEVVSEREQSEIRASRLRDALNEMSESDRVLIHLYYFEKKDLAEIATIINVPRERLKMRLSRARQRISEIWNDGQHE